MIDLFQWLQSESMFFLGGGGNKLDVIGKGMMKYDGLSEKGTV